MDIEEIIYHPLARLSFTSTDVSELVTSALTHYDGLCRSAAGLGGLLRGLKNQASHSMTAEICADMGDVDLLMKILERSDNAGLQQELRAAFERLTAEYHRLNKPDMHLEKILRGLVDEFCGGSDAVYDVMLARLAIGRGMPEADEEEECRFVIQSAETSRCPHCGSVLDLIADVDPSLLREDELTLIYVCWPCRRTVQAGAGEIPREK